MRRVYRKDCLCPVNWGEQVARALPDYGAFLQTAKRFERLRINSKARRSGFSEYAAGKSRFPAIWRRHKELIAAMSHRKCVYCEGPINAPRASHVEHFKPKSIFPSLAYEWRNYFLGCAGCNGAKGDKWPKRGEYVRPDRGDPSRHFVFAADGTVKAAKHGGAADRMLKDFDLGRQWLSDQRKLNIEKMLNMLNEALRLVRAGHRSEAKRLAKTLLGTVGGPETAYSIALTQCYWRAWKHGRPRERL
jgi:uncharacterized protein (TIGR02646 family)